MSDRDPRAAADLSVASKHRSPAEQAALHEAAHPSTTLQGELVSAGTDPWLRAGFAAVLAVVIFLCGIYVGYTLARRTSSDPEVARLRASICVLLDEIGADSLGAADRFACPPR